MDQEKMRAAGIDCQEGIARFVGKRELYEKYVLLFPKDPTFPALKAAMESGDTAAAFQSAHTLKGASGNLSFNRLMNDVKPLVEALRSGNLELARTLYPPVETDYQAVIDAIEG